MEHLSETAEDLLKDLWVMVEESRKQPDMEVLKNNADFKTLVEKGYVLLKPEAFFTQKGLHEGMLCVRRHRLAEKLLHDILQVKSGQIHASGCKFEHGLHRGVEDKICILLGHPRTCPHGQKIPPGKCCAKKETEVKSLVLPASKMKKGDSGKIAFIHTQNNEILKKVMTMGALPGVHIKILHRFPAFVIQIGLSQFATDKKIAEHIHVWIDR